MFDDIQLFDPDFTIDCARFDKCHRVYSAMKSKGIRKSYVYGMCYKPTGLTFDFLKVGMSCPSPGESREPQVGERVVRQLSWVPGWKGEHVRSSHGADFWLGIEHFLIPNGKLPEDFNKNDLVVAVWDITERMKKSDINEHDELKATAWAEGELVYQYKTKFDKLPNLNIQDPSKSKHYTTGYTPKSVWKSLFG